MSCVHLLLGLPLLRQPGICPSINNSFFNAIVALNVAKVFQFSMLNRFYKPIIYDVLLKFLYLFSYLSIAFSALF